MALEDLDNLRNEMKTVTNQIIGLINQRMEIAKRIGEIKTKLDMDIIDDRVEQEIKNYLFENKNIKDTNAEFSSRIVNLLISESVRIQINQKERFNGSGFCVGSKETDNGFRDESRNYKPLDGKSDYTLRIKIKNHMDVFNLAKELDARGMKIIHFEVGELDLPPPLEVKKELSNVFDNRKYHYTQASGINQLRNKIVEYLNNTKFFNNHDKINEINPETLLITPGGRYAIFCAFSAMLKPGDEIVIIEPVWPAYQDCADFLGTKTRVVKTKMEENWEPNTNELENLININTKIICLNYPNNPTGKILSKNTVEKIISIARKNNIYILSDEVYSSFSYKQNHSILNFDYSNAIMIGSFSKSYAMTGFRVGFACSPDKILIDKMKKIQSLSLTSVAEPMQYCALAALNSGKPKYSEIVKRRLDILSSYLRKMPFNFNLPDGGMYIFAQIDKSLNLDDLTLVEKLLHEGVAIAPGRGFGNSYHDFIRISACIEEKSLIEGLEIMASFIKNI